MFERYTEKARRVIFFARYEASQFGSPCIESEHLLLGLLREDKRLVLKLKIEDPIKIRQQIEAHNPQRPSIPFSIDLPLSEESRAILMKAADAADRLQHDRIDTNHLLLATLAQRCDAAELLRQYGVTPEAVRTIVMEPPAVYATSLPHQRRTRLSDTIEIHSAKWDAGYIHDRVEACAEIFWYWHKEAWRARDMTVHRGSGRISFDLTLADNSTEYEIVKAGWKKDHCAVCHWELFEDTDDSAHGFGYTNGREWLCTECYEKFLGNPNFFASNYPEIT